MEHDMDRWVGVASTAMQVFYWKVEIEAEPEGIALDSPVDLRSNLRLWL